MVDLWKISDSMMISSENGEYYVSYQNRCYLVSKYTYKLIALLKEGKALEHIREEFRISFGFDDDSFELVLDSFNKLVDKFNEETKRRKSYIKNKIVIIRSDILEIVTRLFRFLFNPFILAVILIFALFFNVFYWVNNDLTQSLYSLRYQDIAIMYLISVAMYIFHEIGHSSATRYFGIKPNDIGFGFYFIFPVFYSDITRIWLLPAKKRIVVNIGGVYFQLIFNALLIVLFEFTEEGMVLRNILKYLIQTNIIVVCYSMMPFLRNDGYWIYSDLFGIKNLMAESDKSIMKLLRFKRIELDKKEISRIAFGILNWMFRVFVICKLIKVLISSFEGIFIQNILTVLKHSFNIVIVLIGLYFMVRHFYKVVTRKVDVSEGF